MTNNITLSCKSIVYHSDLDEELFFLGIKKIPSIVKYYGKGNKLFLCFTKKDIPDDELRMLLGLFYRYNIDMQQLKIFLNKNNGDWFFNNKDAYWHEKVFI